MNIHNLLQRIIDINNKYEQFAKITGENFNVFSILRVQSYENYHSLFIADLLNPNGSHGQYDLYLRLFLNELNILSNYNELKSAKVITEKQVGNISSDYSEGGRIDIFIEHEIKNIIIENKVYAGDQPNQLARYYKFDSKSHIIYLTLDGKKPTAESLGNLPIDHIICISYQEHILNWLEQCIEKSALLPIIRETLMQYSNTIKKLTNQCSTKDKEMEITKLILSSEENFNSVVQLNQAFNKINSLPEMVASTLKKVFIDKYNATIEKWPIKKICSIAEYDIGITFSNEDGYLHYGIFPLKNNQWPHEEPKFDWKQIPQLQIINEVMDLFFKKIYPDHKNTKNIAGYYSGENYFCWVPFGQENNQSYLFNKSQMTFADYKWLSNPENQEKLAQYALNLSEQIIDFMKNHIKSSEVTFLV